MTLGKYKGLLVAAAENNEVEKRGLLAHTLLDVVGVPDGWARIKPYSLLTKALLEWKCAVVEEATISGSK